MKKSDSGAGASQADKRDSRQGHCFFIKDIELLTKTWECGGCGQRFNRHDNYNRHVTGGTCDGGKTKLICPGGKFERIMNSSEKVFYGGNTNFSYAACQWIEKQSELIGEHIHHALCGHGGEFSVKIGGKKFFVDGYDPKTRTIFQYYGCKWHGCPCRKERNSLDEKSYSKTIELQEKMKEQGFKLISVWECERPELKNMILEKEFRPYPYFIVYDFEALHKKMDESQTEELTITSRHVPVSVAINDNLTNEPVFIVDQDPGNLINSFMKDLQDRQRKIAEMVECLYPQPESDDDGKEKKENPIWRNWVNQVPVFGFNSGRYDINMIKEYFVRDLAIISDVNVAKKENSYMFLSTPKFKFLDVKNYLAPGLSYDAWCRAYGCELQKLAFPYEWFDSFEKLNHKGPVKYEDFFSSLKGGNISQEEYQNFCDEFHKRGCVTMKDWLKEYILADVKPFIEALEKTREQYYKDEIDLLKDAVSIPGISMMYVLNESLKRRKYGEPYLFAPGDPCYWDLPYSGRYDINMIKEYFVRDLAIISDVNVAKKENSYMFLSTPKFKFLDVKNYLAPGLSYDAWCRAYGCELQKLAFPYEWFDSFEKLNHKGPVKYEDFFSSLKGGNISQEEYQNFCDEFHKRGCVTMKDWLKEYNLADVKPFIEALEKTREQYYKDEIDLLKDAVSIPGISMMYVLKESLKRRKYGEPYLFAPGDPCYCKRCSADCEKEECEKCKEIFDGNCKICTKNEAYEMLKTGMIGGPSIVFCRYSEAGVSKIRSHIYSGADAKICRSVQGLDASSLYLFCSGQEMPCGKEKGFHCDPGEKAERERNESKAEIIQNVLNDKLFGFFQVDIEVPKQLRKHFSELSPLFVLSVVPEDQIPQHMQDYKINTGRKKIKNNKKLLGVMKAEKILLYSPLLKWYLNHGLQVTKIHRYISYTPGRPFKWFPEEVSSARRAADQDKNKRQLGDTAKLKGNSFYGKMIENQEKHMNTKFTTNEKLIDEIFRSPFFEDLEEVSEGAFEVRQRKRQVTITRPYQCGIAVYQLAKLRMLEFYYDFLDKFCDRRDFELIQMDTDSFYMALSANDFDDIIKPDLKELYKDEKPNWLVTDEYSKRVPGLFKPEFKGKRMIALTSKCYYADNGESKAKFSCKGVSRRQNKMSWERYINALFGSIDKVTNIGFRKKENHIVTYEQTKLGLSAYYDKRVVHEDGIHTSCLCL